MRLTILVLDVLLLQIQSASEELLIIKIDKYSKRFVETKLLFLEWQTHIPYNHCWLIRHYIFTPWILVRWLKAYSKIKRCNFHGIVWLIVIYMLYSFICKLSLTLNGSKIAPGSAFESLPKKKVSEIMNVVRWHVAL